MSESLDMHRTAKMELDITYGYPLLKLRDYVNAIRWYYPHITDGYNPTLIEGRPIQVAKENYVVNLFVPNGAFAIPYLLNMTELNAE